MKKEMILLVCAILVMSGCNTYTSMGAYTGSTLGSILGSAIGGITGGPRGSDYGTIIGMAGGAIIGGAIGAKTDQARMESMQQARVNSRNNSGYANTPPPYAGVDNGSQNDDRIYDFGDSGEDMMTTNLTGSSEILMSNLRFVNSQNDAVLRSNQVTKIVFELRNVSGHTLYNIHPVVEEITENKHIWVSPSAYIENLEPGKAVRYTAMVSCGKLKNGTAAFRVSILRNGLVLTEPAEFTLPTLR